ncbi:MAG: phospholipase D family protein [Paracoccaceae bacterium]
MPPDSTSRRSRFAEKLRGRPGLTDAYPERPLGIFRPLVTAEQGFPALERAAAAAVRSIWLAFRIFDPSTRLRCPDLGAETWFELLRERLEAGVQVRVMISDFDPLGAPKLHEDTWASIAALWPLYEAGDFEVMAVRHDARVGRGLRFGFGPLALHAIGRQRRALNEAGDPRAALARRPGLWRYLRHSRSRGEVRWRPLSLPRLYPATYHQKIAVFDTTRAVIGGLDVNERRYDEPTHTRPAEQTWHDVSVEVDGPVATDIARHVAELWNRDRLRMAAMGRQYARHAPDGAMPVPRAISALAYPDEADATRATEGPAQALRSPGRGAEPTQAARAIGSSEGALPDPAPAEPDGRIQLLRTVAEHARRPWRMAPKVLRAEIERRYLEEFARARDLLFIETQFFRSTPVIEALERAAGRAPGLGLILVLPAAPEQVAFDGESGIAHRFGEKLQTDGVERVAAAFGERFVAVSPCRPVASDSDGRDQAWGAPIVYVHAKLMVRDDESAIVSSANLNGRSLRWDIEAGVWLHAPATAAELRRRLFRHWLPGDAGEEYYRPETAVAAWRALSQENAARAPAERRGLLLPYDPEPAEEFALPGPGLPEELV